MAHLLSGGRDPVGPRQGLLEVSGQACPPGGAWLPGRRALCLAFLLHLQVPPSEKLLLACSPELFPLLGPRGLPHEAASGHVGAAAAALTGLLPALALSLVALSPPGQARGRPGVWADHDDLPSTCCCLASSSWNSCPGSAQCQEGGKGEGSGGGQKNDHLSR